MDRNARYEILRNEAENVRDQDVDNDTAGGPVVSGVIEEEVTVVETDPAELQVEGAPKVPEPPSYNIATSLPTYEEAEQNKETDEQFRQQKEHELETQAQSSSSSSTNQRVGDVYLGTDGIFICSFLLAFLFNCVGLFAILCVSQTIAARFGAVAGFGLSIVKYVTLMKYQNWVGAWNDGYSWLWWFTLFLGLLMFFRGSLQYVRIKHQWNKLSQQTRGRIYLYF